jgi:hypothetical protein
MPRKSWAALDASVIARATTGTSPLHLLSLDHREIEFALAVIV